MPLRGRIVVGRSLDERAAVIVAIMFLLLLSVTLAIALVERVS